MVWMSPCKVCIFPVAQRVKNLLSMQETWVQSLGWEDPLEKVMTNPLWYSCLENPMDRRFCSPQRRATVHGVTKSQTWLSDYHHRCPLLLGLPAQTPTPPFQVVTEHQAEFPVLYSSFPLVIHFTHSSVYVGFPGGSEVKAPACNAGDLGSIPGSGRFPGEGNDNPLQYSYLENPMDRGAWCQLQSSNSSHHLCRVHMSVLYICVSIPACK